MRACGTSRLLRRRPDNFTYPRYNLDMEAERKSATRIKECYFHSMDSRLAGIAMNIVQYVAEIKKADGERLPGYHDSPLESLRFSLFSPAPNYKEMEIGRITGALQLDLTETGANDPFLQMVLGGKSPHDVATVLVNGTSLEKPEARKKLIDGGEPAVNASMDPMIVLARRLDPMRRDLIKWMQDNVQSVEQRGGEQLGRARFAVYGPGTYPDATFTIIGGNSGSPVINGKGELVGLIFDGNIESLVGDYVYDIETNRAVAVHTAGMTEVLKKLYNVGRLLSELLGR